MNIRNGILIVQPDLDVFFLNKSFVTVSININTTAAQLIQLVLQKKEVKSPSGFAAIASHFTLYESLDGHTLSREISKTERVMEAMQVWSSNKARYILGLRLFTPDIYGLELESTVNHRYNKKLTFDEYLTLAEVIDPALMQLQYIQAVHNILSREYPVTEKEAIYYGALDFIYTFGLYNSREHKLGFLGHQILEFIPAVYIPEENSSQLELLLLKEVETQSVELVSQFYEFKSDLKPIVSRQYLNSIFQTSFYGSTYFYCKFSRSSSCLGTRSFPPEAIVGINCNRMTIYNRHSEILKGFTLPELSRWGYQLDLLFFIEISVSHEWKGTVELHTKAGKMISELLTDYALAYINSVDYDTTFASTSICLQTDKLSVPKLPANPIKNLIVSTTTGNSYAPSSSAYESMTSASSTRNANVTSGPKNNWESELARKSTVSARGTYKKLFPVMTDSHEFSLIPPSSDSHHSDTSPRASVSSPTSISPSSLGKLGRNRYSVLKDIRESVSGALSADKDLDIKQYASIEKEKGFDSPSIGSVKSKLATNRSAKMNHISELVHTSHDKLTNNGNLKKSVDMVIRIQRLYRGYRARVVVGQMIWNMVESGELVIS